MGVLMMSVYVDVLLFLIVVVVVVAAALIVWRPHESLPFTGLLAHCYLLVLRLLACV